jgi:hypothetical protein
MGFTDQRDIGLDEIDYVSAWLRRLAFGMMVLGVVFATLDWCDLLPHVAPAQQLSQVATNQAAPL